MKKLFQGFKSNTYTFKDILWLLIPALLLIILPVFLWAAITQRAEIRKKAASYPPPGTNPIVWNTNYVSLTADNFYVYTNGAYYWGNSADLQVHSDPGNPGYTTLEAIWHESAGNLTVQTEMRVFMYFKSDGKTWWADEIRTYNGRIPGDWVYYYGRFFERPLGQPFTGTIDLTSSPGSQYTGRLHFGNMRLLAFLSAIGPCWNEVGGSGDDLFWRNGCRGMHIPGQMCTQAITPLTEAEKAAYREWVAKGRPPIPGCGFVTPTPTCIPRPGCLDAKPPCLLPENPNWCKPTVSPTPYPDPQCTGKADGTRCWIGGCPPCPTGATVCPLCIPGDPGICRNGQCIPEVSPTPVVTQPPGACQRGTPLVTVDNQNQTGNPGQTLTYRYTIRNTDSSGCGATTFNFTTSYPSGAWATVVQSNATVSPGQSVTIPMYVGSPTNAPDGAYTISLVINGAASYHYMIIPVTYTVRREIIDQTLDIRFRFAGVTTDAARNAKVIVHIVTQTRNLVTTSLPLTYLGNGIYSAVFKPSPVIPPGEKLYFLVKGEKHASGKFCLQSGQTNPCPPNVWINMPIGTRPIFDFTGIPLRPGDVYIQNYITNNEDYNKVRALLSKPSSQLTAQDLMVGDLNYDKTVNGMDILLIRQTLDTQFDPS